jgi:hypothetical protein
MGNRKVASGWTQVRWTRAMRDGFLDRLAETCNVKESAEAIGVRAESVYLLRRKEEPFRAEWKVSLEAGYELLETRLVARALAQDSEDGLDVELAIRLLTRHGNALKGKVPLTGKPPSRATREDTDAAILKKIEMLDRARKAGVA